MHATRLLALAAALLATPVLPAVAQQPAAPASLTADLRTDIDQVEKKMLDLARAIPADKYDWRPAAGVRSIAEVLKHVAADNYLIPAALGHPADPATGIKGDDYKTAMAFEQRPLDRDATIAQLEKSFTHLDSILAAMPAAALGEQVSMFGEKFTGQQALILTATHLHEHLGQLIAYARSNAVVPPWSQGS